MSDDEKAKNILIGTINRVNLGLNDRGVWFRETNGNITLVSKDSYMMPLLPCLEIPLNEFLQWLETNLKDHGVDGKPTDLFPVNELVLTGLKSKSEHWIQCALNWLSDIHATNEILGSLLEISQSGKIVSQSTRHQAFKIYSKQTKL